MKAKCASRDRANLAANHFTTATTGSSALTANGRVASEMTTVRFGSSLSDCFTSKSEQQSQFTEVGSTNGSEAKRLCCSASVVETLLVLIFTAQVDL
jgi:hypothetical protein